MGSSSPLMNVKAMTKQDDSQGRLFSRPFLLVIACRKGASFPEPAWAAILLWVMLLWGPIRLFQRSCNACLRH
jgi:hypothetical protein